MYLQKYLKNSVLAKIFIVFHNLSVYDYHFIIKRLVEFLGGQLICLRENAKKFITFSVPIEKDVTRIDEKGKQITKTISYRSQFIKSLSSLVMIFLKEFIKLNVNMDIMIKNVKRVELKTKIMNATLNTQMLKVI